MPAARPLRRGRALPATPPPGRNAALALAGMLATGLLTACGGNGPTSATTDSLSVETSAATGPTAPPSVTSAVTLPPSAPAPTPAAPAGALDTEGPPLRRGSNGKRVVALQRALATIGHDPGSADGDFGARTENAVKAFQTAVGLESDGVVGPKTIEKINEQLGTARG